MIGAHWVRINSIVASFLLHCVLLVLLPGMSEILPTSISAPIEVELVPLKEEIAVGMTREPARASGQQPAERTEKTKQSEKTKTSTRFSAPPLTLPKRELADEAQPELSAQSLPGIEIPKHAGGLIAPEIKPPEPGKLPDSLDSIPEKPPEYAWLPENRASTDTSVTASPEPLTIEGPVSKRRVTFQPPPPDIVTTSAITLRLKFWVHPDGTVGRIVPMVRAEANIEKAAISFLEKWRFEPVDKSNGDQWGILPIQLKLR